MTTGIAYLRAGPDDERHGDALRLARYRHARAFVEGDQWPDRARRGERRLVVNYARTLIRKVASYVFPGPVTFSVPAEGIAGAATVAARRAEIALAETTGHLDLAALDLALAAESAILGDAALKVTWDAAAASPAVVAVDPATLHVRTSPDDPRRIRRLVQTYGLSGAGIAETFGPAGRPSPAGALDPDRVYPVTEDWTDARWRVDVAGQPVRDGPNPYGWIPYVVIPNNPRPHALWGVSDLEDLYDVCAELNRRLSVLARLLDAAGAPVAVLENVDGSDGIAVAPGAKWNSPEGARAYVLDLLGGGGVGLHVQVVDLLYRTLHDLSETPRTAFGDAGRDLSGVALEVEIQPLVQQVQRKRRGWDAAFRQRNHRILDLLERFGGHDLGGLRRTETIWPDILPSDTAASVRNAVRLVDAGIRSRRTAIAALGDPDPDTELARIARERGREDVRT